MGTKKRIRPILGSAVQRIKGSRVAGRPDPEDVAEVTVYLRSRSPLSEKAISCRASHLTHQEHACSHGAHDEDLDKVRAFADAHGLTVVEASAAKRRVRIKGTVEALNRAFGVDLLHFEHAAGKHRGHEGEVHLPEELHEIVVSVLGLDDRTMAYRCSAESETQRVDPDNIPQGCFSAFEVAGVYDFPKDLDGEGQCIGIIELGGGFFRDELETYFTQFGVALPEIITVGPNLPGPRSNPSVYNLEVALDIEVAGSVAPKAKYVLYFGSATDQGFINTLKDAIHDGENSPSVISVSWSMSESGWSKSAALLMSETLKDAGALGVTVCVSSGDRGAYGTTENLANGHVTPTIPSTVPYALSCGGTRLSAPDLAYQSEIVWNQLDSEKQGASGGGVSCYFELPAYQSRAEVPAVPKNGDRPGFAGRGVPDVAGHGDPRVGYLMYGNSEWAIHGGTSAVAPLWAGLISLLNQGLKRRLGFVNKLLYDFMSNKAFHQITSGNNGYYDAGLGWNACTGIGSPIGSKLLAALAKKA